jgi:hypothetical protein
MQYLLLQISYKDMKRIKKLQINSRNVKKTRQNLFYKELELLLQL